MENEYWKSVYGYEGIYSVSNLGRIRRDKSCQGTRSGKIIKSRELPSGYHQVFLSLNSKVKTIFVHKIVARTFIGVKPINKEINHKDTIKSNNHSRNLEYVTSLENKNHALRNGLINNIGEGHYRALLNNDIVTRIRNDYIPHKFKAKDLSIKYGIKLRTVRSIIHKENWNHVK